MITVVTHFPSPYQVEFFNAINQELKNRLRVVYMTGQSSKRLWMQKEDYLHDLCILEDDKHKARKWVQESDLVIFNYYYDLRALELINQRASQKRPWVFWGERLGYQHPRLGRLIRKVLLKALHKNPVPIWGIGEYAVVSYQKEFGLRRDYFNIPYYSNLKRFHRTSSKLIHENIKILFSGSLIFRKGIDLLCRAYKQIFFKYPWLELIILGEGELKAKLATELKECNSKCRFLGFKDWSELPQVYAEADILCVPSRYDGWGLVVPEGLASGLPVIATDKMGAALDLIQDGRNGWVIPGGDLEALQQSLSNVAEMDRREIVEMSSFALESIKFHNIENGVNKFIKAADSAIESYSKPFKKKIIHLWAPDFDPSSGGIGTYSNILYRRIKKITGIHVRTLPKRHIGIKDNQLANSYISFFGFGHLGTFFYTVHLIWWAFIERPDYIITTHVNFSPVANLIKKYIKIRYAVCLHGIDVWGLKNQYRINGLKEADYLLPVSEFTKTIVIKEQKIAENKFFVLPDTVDSERFRIGVKNRRILRRYGIPIEKKIVLTVCHLSRLERYKGYDRILKIWPSILKEVTNAHYVLVGQGDDLPYIKETIQKLGIQDSVTLTGYVPAHELPYLYQSAELFVMPSTGEGFGIVFLEALASGLPVLAGNLDASAEPLLNGDLGVLINPNDENQLMLNLISLLKRMHPNHQFYNPEYLRTRVIEAYGLENFDKKLTCFFSKINIL
ncbi:MAG: glycosyltransferase family 4 protein [Methylacidiphilales bacterium]|nr:glycosyltransferase family 4 protein [Candidatus Methylacidiphilales bacterium]MDW8348947.1 glycosyltransferase family 4 protein [Verrucomicrobiae bacterium]